MTHSAPRRVRSIFISDVHLGMRAAKIDQLLAFLDGHHVDHLFLVGDIVDGWTLKNKWRWPLAYNQLLQRILALSAQGTQIIYLPGNHDAFLHSFADHHFGGVEIKERHVHIAADGKTYLVLHGDQFDTIVQNQKLLSHLGHWAYAAALWFNRPLNWMRSALGFGYFSLSTWGKEQIKNRPWIKTRFESALVTAARQASVDGVICGHIHIPESHQHLGVHYLNCGDWIESCTAIVEHFDGRMELVGAAHVASVDAAFLNETSKKAKVGYA